MTMSDGVPSTIGDPRRRERRSSCLFTRIEMDRPVNLVRWPLYCARHCSAWRLRHCRIDPGLSWPAEPSTRHASTIRSIRMCSRNRSGRGSEAISLGWCSSTLCAVS